MSKHLAKADKALSDIVMADLYLQSTPNKPQKTRGTGVNVSQTKHKPLQDAQFASGSKTCLHNDKIIFMLL